MSNSPQTYSKDIKTIFSKYRRKVILRAVIISILLISNFVIGYVSFKSFFDSELVGILVGIICFVLSSFFTDLKVILNGLRVNNDIRQIEAKLNSQERLSTILTSDINLQNDPRIKYIESQLLTIIKGDTNSSLQVRYNLAPFAVLLGLLIFIALYKQVPEFFAVYRDEQKINDIETPELKSLQDIINDKSIETEIRNAVQNVVTTLQSSDYKETGKLSNQTLEAIKQASEKIEQFEKNPPNTNELSRLPTPTPTVTPNKDQQSKSDKDQKKSEADNQNTDQQKKDQDKKETKDNNNGSGDKENQDQKQGESKQQDSQNNQGEQSGQKEQQNKDNQNNEQAKKEDNKQGSQSNKDENKEAKKDENKDGNKEGKKEEGKEPSNEGSKQEDKKENQQDNKQGQSQDGKKEQSGEPKQSNGNQSEGQENKNQPEGKQGAGQKLDQAKKTLNDLKKKNDQKPQDGKSESSQKPQSKQPEKTKNKDSKSGDQSGTGDSKNKDQELSLLGEGEDQTNNQIIPKKIEEKKLGNPDEKTDERYTSDDVKISDNKDPAKPKTQLGQFDKLGQQEVQGSTADKIPLEYKEFLTR